MTKPNAAADDIFRLDYQRSFAKRKVSEGRFGSISEKVRASMRLLEEQETKLDRLKAEIASGLDSGPSEPFDVEHFLHERHTDK